MIVYRLAKRAYAHDLSGKGAEISGGRWNHRGVPVIYTASSISLALVEYLVHLPASLAPPDLTLAEIEVPNSLCCERITIGKLPPDWKKYPAMTLLQDVGTEWQKSKRSLLLRVPSAVVPEEDNILINPTHADMKKISVKTTRYFLDDRLLQKTRKK